MSSARTDELECDEILELGLSWQVNTPNNDNPEIHGWLEFSQEGIKDAGLEIDYDENPERHVHIVWPPKDEDRHHATVQLFQHCYRLAVFEPPVTPDYQPENVCEHVQPYRPPRPPKKER